MILHVLIAMVAGWLQRHQQQVITYLLAENRVLKAQLGGRRLRLTDTERRRLAALAHPLGRQRLKEVATLVTPDTLLRWYQRLIAQKFDGSSSDERWADRVSPRRSSSSCSAWQKRMRPGAIGASRGPWRTWGMPSTRSPCATSSVATTWNPLPNAAKAGMSWAQFLKLPLGGPRRHGLLHGRGSDLARARDLLRARGDGAGHAAGPDRGHHATSYGGFYAAMRPAID